MSMRRVRRTSPLCLGLMLSVALALGMTGLADARITKIVIDRVESPTFGGATFGEVGQHEKIVGRAFGEVNPHHPLNAIIQDIDLAPKNDRGMVEFKGFGLLPS